MAETASMNRHQPLPWSVDDDGRLVDASGRIIRLVGVALVTPWPVSPEDEAFEPFANRDLIVRSVTERNEEARRQVVAAAESRGAALAMEGVRRAAEERAVRELAAANANAEAGHAASTWRWQQGYATGLREFG